MSDNPTLFDELTEPVLVAPTRRTDPQTSRDAAATVNITKGQQAVLAEFRLYRTLTDEQLIEALRIRATSCPEARLSDSGARSRRAELVTKGLLIDSGHRGRTQAGRATIVWALA
jgi:hypothetical protein